MPRVPRIKMENALCYITSQGDNDQEIFRERGDYIMYLELLKKSKEQYKFKLFAFCLLPNHLHLLLEVPEEATISQIMHSLNSNYTKYFNPKYEIKGHLFQERYKMILVEKEPRLLSLAGYIHLQPKMLVPAQDFVAYPYSSFKAYSGEVGALLDIAGEVSEANAYLKGKPYPQYIKEFTDTDIENLRKVLNRKTILGSDEFVEKVMAKVDEEKEKAEETAEIVEAGAVPAGRHRHLMLAGVAVIVILGITASYLYMRALAAKEYAKKELAKKSAEMATKLSVEKEDIRRDLSEKYRADMVSFQAMSKRLELEKQKAAELESKLKTPPVKVPPAKIKK